MALPTSLPQPVLVTAAVVVWYLSSALEVPMWTRAVHTYPNLLGLTLVELVLGQVVAVPVLLLTQDRPWKTLNEVTITWRGWCLAIGAAFAVYQMSRNASISTESDTLTHLVRLTEPLLALVIARVLLHDVPSPRAVMCMLVVLTGAALAATTGHRLQLHGPIVFTGLTIFSVQIRNVLFKSFQTSDTPHSIQGAAVAFLLSNTVAIPVVILFIFVVQIAYNGAQFTMLLGHLGVHSLVVTGCFVVHQMASYVVLMSVSLPTHTLLNTIRMAVIIFTKSLIFNFYTWFQFVGVGVIGVGMYLYIGSPTTPTDDTSDSLTEIPRDPEEQLDINSHEQQKC